MTTFSEYIKTIDWRFFKLPVNYFTHNIYPYPARLNPHIPKNIIGFFKNQNINILDNCCGGGTTILECLIRNKNGIGIDANPFAVLVSKVKCTPLYYESLMKYAVLVKKSLKDQLFGSGIMKFMGVPEPEKIPLPIEEILEGMPQDKKSKVLNKHMIKNLITVGTVINSNSIPQSYKDVFILAFSKTVILSMFGVIYERKGIYDIFVKELNILINKIGILGKYKEKMNSSIDIYQGDARNLRNIYDESIDLVITSPPRLSVMDYHLHNKYEMQFLGMNFRVFGKKEIGTTSRFTNNRWKLTANFFGDIYQMLYEIARVLKYNAYATIITGNATIESCQVNVVDFLSSCAEMFGMRLIHSVIRSVKDDPFSSKGKGANKEEVLLFFIKESESQNFAKKYLFDAVKKEIIRYEPFDQSNKIQKAIKSLRSSIKIVL